MHRPLLKIPVKYMDTEKAQAEHSAENTTLAVTVISWKVLRRLSCKSICAIYGGGVVLASTFFSPNGAVAPIKALRVYLNVREKVWSWGQPNLRQNDGTCASGGRGGECPCECLPYMTYRTWTAKSAFLGTFISKSPFFALFWALLKVFLLLLELYFALFWHFFFALFCGFCLLFYSTFLGTFNSKYTSF